MRRRAMSDPEETIEGKNRPNIDLDYMISYKEPDFRSKPSFGVLYAARKCKEPLTLA